MASNQESYLTGWAGDTDSLLAELKRRSGVQYDHELARYLGVAQTTVSNWRTQGRIPEAALLRAERLLAAAGAPGADRELAARMVALRLAEYWHQRGVAAGLKGGRGLFYRQVAEQWPKIMQATLEQIALYERSTGRGALDLAPQLLSDDDFMEQLVAIAQRL